MSRRTLSLVALAVGGVALAACRCNTDTPGASTAPTNPQILAPNDSAEPFAPRTGPPRIPGARISPRIFENMQLPDAAAPESN